jgi:hypothetical protein
LALLCVVLDEFLDVGLGDQDLGQDLVGGGSPDEGFGVAVPVGDVGPDPGDQGLDRGEGAAADRLPGDDAEPVLD